MRQAAHRVVYGVTAPVTARAFLPGQLAMLREQGWDVHLVCGEPGAEDFGRREGLTTTHVVRATRAPSVRDPLTLVSLWWLLLRLRPAVTVMGTPKMGVFGTIAACLARVPRRIYLVHGYRGESLYGPLARVMWLLEWLGCTAATDVVAVSPSLRERLIAERVVPAHRVQVLGSGSANGVDVSSFRPPTADETEIARRALGLPPSARAICSVGRLTRDKGLVELPEVWRELAAEHPDLWLLVAGVPEPTGTDDEHALSFLAALPRVRLLGHVDDVRQVYLASDLLLMFSHREGLGMVALEAGACGIPCVAWSVTGVVDAVIDGTTGILVPRADVSRFIDEACSLLRDDERRRRLGHAAAARITHEFDQTVVWERWAQLLLPLPDDLHPHGATA